MSENKNYWKVPTFEKMEKLADLMDKILKKEIDASKEQIQDLHNILEIKRKLDEKLGKKK